jgi:hypothetical protein
MTVKRTQKGSRIADQMDLNNDGILSDDELHDLKIKEMQIRLENDNAKQDQQRYMVWFSALSVTAYIGILMTNLVPLDRLDYLSSIGSTWVISNMGIIGAFIASSAFVKNGYGR